MLEQKKQLHKDFWQGKGPSLIFIPSARMVQYDTDNYEARFNSPQKMLAAELKRANAIKDWPTDGIPTIRPNLGTVFIPAIAGQPYLIKDGQMLWPDAHLSPEKILASTDTDIENSHVFKLARDFYDINAKESDSHSAAYLADTQGVFDILHLMRGDEIFYELSDPHKKKTTAQMLEAVTELYIKVTGELKKHIPEPAAEMIHGHGTQQGLYFPHAGIRLSEDTPTLLSPAMIDEFVIPYMEKAAAPFGNAFVHFCGKHDYLYEAILKCDFVKAIDLGNPESYDTRWLFELCAKTDTVFYGKIAALENEPWQDYIKRVAAILNETSARCVLRPDKFPEGRDECKQMLDMWHELTDKG